MDFAVIGILFNMAQGRLYWRTCEINYDRWTISFFHRDMVLQPCAQWHKSWSIDISAKVVIAFDRPWPSMGSAGGCWTFDENSKWFVQLLKTKMVLYTINIIGLCLRLTFDVAHHPVTNDITSVSSTQLDMLRFYWIHESNDLDLTIDLADKFSQYQKSFAFMI